MFTKSLLYPEEMETKVHKAVTETLLRHYAKQLLTYNKLMWVTDAKVIEDRLVRIDS